MRKRTLLLFCGILLINISFGQNQKSYFDLIKEAESFYHNREYLKSGEKYSIAFMSIDNRGSIDDRYNASCSWALANQADSAFIQLFFITQKGNYSNYNHIISDSDLNSLHTDKRWNEIIEMVRMNKETADAKLDKALVLQLDTIFNNDQRHRKELVELTTKYGWDSQEVKDKWEIIKPIDSVNLKIVCDILDSRGWLGADIIGGKGNHTLFLVIQHADLKVQDKYMPIMREAVKKGNANARSLALLEDRVALGHGRKQTYGSQIGTNKETGENYVLPLEDPENVDKRRQELGLGNLEDYLKQWNIVWNAEEYKMKLPEIESIKKK